MRLQADGAATLSVPHADAIAAASSTAADDAVELSLQISWVARKAGGGGTEQTEVERAVVTVAVSAHGTFEYTHSDSTDYGYISSTDYVQVSAQGSFDATFAIPAGGEVRLGTHTLLLGPEPGWWAAASTATWPGISRWGGGGAALSFVVADTRPPTVALTDSDPDPDPNPDPNPNPSPSPNPNPNPDPNPNQVTLTASAPDGVLMTPGGTTQLRLTTATLTGVPVGGAAVSLTWSLRTHQPPESGSALTLTLILTLNRTLTQTR